VNDPYDPATAAVAAYDARSAMLFEVLTEGSPTEAQARMLTWAHGILGSAIEAETFDPEPPGLPAKNSA
jgi:hypothetical protein